MNIRCSPITLFRLLLLSALPAMSWAQIIPAAAYHESRIVVMPRAGADLSNLHSALNTQRLRSFPGIGNLEVIQLPAGVPVETILFAFQQSPQVAYAEPDYFLQALVAPNDFRYGDGSLANLHNTGLYGGTPGADIRAPEGWSLQNTASNIIVAVIDSGVRHTHEDLVENMWINPGESGLNPQGQDKSTNGLDDDGNGFVDDVHGINAQAGTGSPIDDYGHGTHVSGTIGARGNNSVGVVGVAWRVKIMACKSLDAAGHGTISEAITCIDYARTKGAQIINASWGSYTFNSTALYDAINSARGAGIIFVAACGNDNIDNDTQPLYPATYNLDNIIAVAATDRNDAKAGFSNFGATTVHLAAPGAPIFSCWSGSDNDYRYFEGTSMAAPHVAGVCALLLARYPNDTYRQIINRVLAATDPLPALAGKSVTGGRLNLFKALGGAGAAPANFSASSTLGAAPLTVRFTDASPASTTNWLWDFGDGTSASTERNPVHAYSSPGEFTVKLTVTDDTSATGSRSQPLRVTGGNVVGPAFLIHAHSRLLGGPGLDDARAVAAANDGTIYVAGSFFTSLSTPAGTLNSAGSGDGFVVRMNPDGTLIWAVRFGGVAMDQPDAIAVSGTNVYVGGYFQGTAAFAGTNLVAQGPPGSADAFLASYHTNGTFQWVRQITGGGDEFVRAIAINPAGGIKVAGSATQGASWDSLASSGNVLFLLTVNSAGQLSTAQTASSSQAIQPGHVIVANDGTTLVAGKFSGTAFDRTSAGDHDAFLAAFGSTGAFLWAFTGGGAARDDVGGLALASDGTAVWGTSFTGSSTYHGRSYTSAKGTWLGQFTTAGSVVSSNFIDGASITALAAGKKGVVQVVATFSTNLTLGGVALGANGGTAAAIAAYLVPGWELAGVSALYSDQQVLLHQAATTGDDQLALAGFGQQSVTLDGTSGASSSSASLNALILRLAPPEYKLNASPEGGSLRLKYPSYYFGATLQTNAAIPGSWGDAPATTVNEPGQRSVTVPMDAQRKFYRLKR
jgi:subtilisin family serine protease